MSTIPTPKSNLMDFLNWIEKCKGLDLVLWKSAYSEPEPMNSTFESLVDEFLESPNHHHENPHHQQNQSPETRQTVSGA